MEDRKRPAIPDQDDTVPPAKRQALAVNGSRSHGDADMPFKEDIEAYQKDAILRQMKEYKREKNLLEAHVADLEKRSAFHDDHIRAIDLWFMQLVDEIRILTNNADTLGAPRKLDKDELESIFPPTLLSSESELFEKHLSSRSEKIKAALTDLFTRVPTASPDVKQLQEQLSKHLHAEKEHIAQLHKLTVDKETVTQQLDSATKRYFIAEKKFDRARSAQVAKLEQQALQSATSSSDDPSSTKAERSGNSNGTDNSIGLEDSEVARKEAVAEAAKLKEQLAKMEAENKKLSEDLTALNARMASLSDDDYAKTELFKLTKSQLVEAIQKLNDLEARSTQIKEENQKLQAERTSYRIQVDEETRATITETEAQLARAETDLTRVRNSRDELAAEIAVLKASQGDHRASLDQLKELASARETRISALEMEIERYKLRIGETQPTTEDQTAYDSMSTEELRNKLIAKQKECDLLNLELPSMEAAWKKVQALASSKVGTDASWEEQVSRLNAEKTKAEQKYFSAMKAKEARDMENRTLRAQNAKSAEILTAHKTDEAHTRLIISNLEKQLAEAKEIISNMTAIHRTSQHKASEQTMLAEGLSAQNTELKKLLSAKETSLQASEHARREAEVEREKYKVASEEAKKQVEVWRKKGTSSQSEEEQALRNIAMCNVCHKNFKDTVIKSCGHVTCKACVEERLTSRSRKCPLCGKAFAQSDALRVHL